MVDTVAPSRAPGHGKLRRDVGPVGLLFAGIGSIIGSGWLFGAFTASGLAGPAALLSWVIAGFMILLIALCYAELGPMFPITGGVVRYPHLVWGSFASYSLGWITWISAAAVPAIEVEGALQYATRYAHFTTKHVVHGEKTYTLTGLGLIVAIALLAVFVVVNYYGVRLFSQINNVLVWWKLAIVVLVIATFLILAFAGHNTMGGTANYTSHGFAPYGSHGIFIAISTAGITFSFLGFRQGIELAGESSNPRRNVPLAVIGSVLITGLLYVLLQVAFTLGVPGPALAKSGSWQNLSFTNDFGPLAAISTLAGATWLAYLLYADAIISPADTGFIYTTVSSRISYAMGRNRNAPSGFTHTNRSGVPVLGLFVTFVVGVVLFMPFPSWQQLVGFITSATVISFGSGPLVLTVLRRELPDRPRPYRLFGGQLIPFVAFYCSNMIVYWAGWSVNKKLFVTVLIGYVVLAIFHFTGDRATMPELAWRAGFWVLPWFGGMALISWLADPQSHPAAFNWVFLINLGFCAAIYLLAVSVRQPRAAIEAHIADAEHESSEEQTNLTPHGRSDQPVR
jgi:amino acid transporter